MFHKVLVANRGAVAARVIRALRILRVKSVAVYSEADAGAPYLEEADESFAIGPSPARESYLNQDVLLRIVAKSRVDGLHPGYGFLAENSTFAQRVQDAGVSFIGPSPKWLAAMGQKTAARSLMADHGMPIIPGSPVITTDTNDVLEQARLIGFPVLVKPAGGGGGIGMIVANDERSLVASVEQARSLAQRSFGTADIYLERLLVQPRHVEFQMLADNHGDVRHLFERDCSTQRRHQKLIEEAPAPQVDREAVDKLANRIADVLKRLGYDNIGTVEMLLAKDGSFNFLEMNTRLQVEHAVSEAITGVDLVAAQIRAAAGDHLTDILPTTVQHQGHAIEARVCAEDPWTHLPAPGMLKAFRPPVSPGIRVETGYTSGRAVTPFYDSLVAKVIVHAETREAAIDRLDEALGLFSIEGIKTNIQFLQAVLRSFDFRAGCVHTGLGRDVILARQGISNG